MNLTYDICKNCGGEYGIHHYSTNQCPVGGREASVNQRQEWMATVFEKENSPIPETSLKKEMTEMEKLNRMQKAILLALYKYDPKPLTVEEISRVVLAEGLLDMTDEEFDKYNYDLVTWKTTTK